MNILFVNYGDLRSNSFGHIAPYANALAKRGHACAVAVEANDAIAPEPDQPRLFELLVHGQLDAGHLAFPDGRPANIVHAWTPREAVRMRVENYLRRHPLAKLVIHLEDNEESVLESYYGRSIAELRASIGHDEPEWHPRLSHPVEYRRFLASADAATLIAPSLYRFLPLPRQFITVAPILPDYPPISAEQKAAARARLRLASDAKIIAYPGGITRSNWDDLRRLIIAVKQLQEKRLPVTLVKTGPSNPDFQKSFSFPLGEVCLDLGYVPEPEVRALLAAADALVQPGKDNAFNRDRFPCKIPEFLASGRPCILPHFYLPDIPDDVPVCRRLYRSDPEEIAQEIEAVLKSEEMGAALARNAMAYVARAYAESRNVENLLGLYRCAIDGTSRLGSVASLTPEDLVRQNEDLRSQAAAAETRLELALRDGARLANENQRLSDSLAAEQDRIRRMRSAFSWRATAPLRALRRQFIDPFERQAEQPPALPSVEEQSALAKETPAEDKKLPPPGHPAYAKDYYKFVEREEWLTSIYIANYVHPQAGPECPKISILLPVYNIAEVWLRRCIDSVRAQIYQNWELCIADDDSSAPHIRPILEAYRLEDSRIKVTFRDQNGHISRASNSAFELATGDYIALLDHDDELPRHALARVAETIANCPHAKLIYSDQDKIDEAGRRFGPHFKPDWNYDLLLGCNVIQQLGVYRRDVFEEVGGFRTGLEGAQDWDLALRVSECCQEKEIVHIPKILYHWRSIEGSTARNIRFKQYAHDAQKKALLDHFNRIGEKVELESIQGIHWRAKRPIPTPQPSVSIIIPTKNESGILEACILSVLSKTAYSNFEIVIIDNGSIEEAALKLLRLFEQDPRVRVICDSTEPFNYSRINNRAIATCDSDIICLLNSDTEVIADEWLDELVSHALRPQIGAVGAKLLYPDGHIQHAGVVMGLGGVADHAFKHLHKDDPGHMYRASLIGRYSAVTGACMAFRRELWRKIDGLDEINLAVSFNDTDFCLRLVSAGYHNLYTPFALLYHKEGATRGDTQTPEQLAIFHTEASYMYRTWPSAIASDPYFNPNLAKSRQDFSYIV